MIYNKHILSPAWPDYGIVVCTYPSRVEYPKRAIRQQLSRLQIESVQLLPRLQRCRDTMDDTTRQSLERLMKLALQEIPNTLGAVPPWCHLRRLVTEAQPIVAELARELQRLRPLLPDPAELCQGGSLRPASAWVVPGDDTLSLQEHENEALQRLRQLRMRRMMWFNGYGFTRDSAIELPGTGAEVVAQEHRLFYHAFGKRMVAQCTQTHDGRSYDVLTASRQPQEPTCTLWFDITTYKQDLERSLCL